MVRAVQRPAARRDFIIHYIYLADNAGMGAPARVRQRKHAGVRIWRVREFEEYLIAYKPRRAGVEIMRLIHAKQDYPRVLK